MSRWHIERRRDMVMNWATRSHGAFLYPDVFVLNLLHSLCVWSHLALIGAHDITVLWNIESCHVLNVTICLLGSALSAQLAAAVQGVPVFRITFTWGLTGDAPGWTGDFLPARQMRSTPELQPFPCWLLQADFSQSSNLREIWIIPWENDNLISYLVCFLSQQR